MRQKYTKMEGLAEMIFARKAAGETNRQIGESYGLTLKQVKELASRQNRKQRLIARGYQPRPKGRPRKNPEDEEIRRKNELIQLRMQVELIGHEISHAFDSKEAQFDKDGNLANWWTAEDLAAFQARNLKIQNYLSAMHPWEGQDFLAGIMTGETCADMAGMKVVLRIAAEKENFDYDAFFRAYANLWLTKDTLQFAYARINDEHAMGYLRINMLTDDNAADGN